MPSRVWRQSLLEEIPPVFRKVKISCRGISSRKVPRSLVAHVACVSRRRHRRVFVHLHTACKRCRLCELGRAVDKELITRLARVARGHPELRVAFTMSTGLNLHLDMTWREFEPVDRGAWLKYGFQI